MLLPIPDVRTKLRFFIHFIYLFFFFFHFLFYLPDSFFFMEHAVHKSEILQDMHKDLFPLYFYHFFLIVERRRCSSNSHMENY